MPSTSLDTGDAAELAELLEFLAGWLTSDPGGNDGEPLFGPGQP